MVTSRAPNPKRRRRMMEEKENHDALLLDQSKNEGKEKELRDLSSSKWQNLSFDLLQLLLDHISSSSIPDLLSFLAVCKSWRSLAKSSPNSISLPPPLLLSSSSPEERITKRSSMYLLKTITPNLDPRTFRSPISVGALNRNCCGCSHGHLIFASTSNHTVFIADLFSSAKFRLKPPRAFIRFSHGVLTAPPSSPSCMLCLIGSGKLLCRRLRAADAEDWQVSPFGSACGFKSIAVFNGKLHVLHYNDYIFVLEFDPLMHWKRLPDAPYTSDMRLADCGGVLLLVHFIRTDVMDYSTGYKIKVYRMDFAEGAWVRVQSIGDWCLFMDSLGSCPLACRSPGKWGGESNCIYFAESHSARWDVLPLDGTKFQGSYWFVTYYRQWPCPAWVYPSMLSIDLVT